MINTMEYKGMSYEQASREAHRLIHGPRGNWYQNLDRLIELKEIMLRELASGRAAA